MLWLVLVLTCHDLGKNLDKRGYFQNEGQVTFCSHALPSCCRVVCCSVAVSDSLTVEPVFPTFLVG